MLKIIDLNEPLTENPEDLCFAFCGHKTILDPNRPADQPWTRATIQQNLGEIILSVFIGFWNGKPCYGVEISLEAIDAQNFHITSLYGVLGRVSDQCFAAYGRALQFLNWRKNHRFCGRCGGKMTLGDSGRALKCEPCNFLNYPRLSPCVIVLITKGDQILLAAAKGRRKFFYSNVAGFIEAGETAEEAIAREADEEVGIKIKNIQYFGSQSWPFPDQLMLAYTAEHDEGEINVNLNEIDDAKWFSVDNLPPVPPNFSISGQLISSFLNKDKGL